MKRTLIKKMSSYELRPNKLGKLVYGVDLNKDVDEELKRRIIQDVTTHRLLVFKNQGVLAPERHLAVSRWFGELESTFFDHPKSPHRDIFRVSNDRNEGCTQVGRTGWHIDGSFQPAPFSHSVYHIVSVPKEGATVFAPLTEIVEGLSPEKRSYWDRLWMLSDRRDKSTRPLIYSHPETGKPVLCFHLGMTSGFVLDQGSENERELTEEETQKVLKDIHHEFVKDDGAIQYHHKWEPGDLIVSDNLSVGHEASADTQRPVSEVGLRVMHRVTVKGKQPPKK